MIKNDTLYQIHHDEGRVMYDTPTNKYTHEFEYRDHLGNLRLSFRDSLATPAGELYMPPVIVQANDYDPWGMDISSFEERKQNNFKYSGKEQYKEFGLDWYDFGARMYDAPIGRWHVVDPLADIARRFSPYVYGNNNPLRFTDPSGMASEEVKDFSYSDGYSNLSARNSSGSVGFSGNYQNIGQDGCPPNCGGYGGGDASTPFKALDQLKPASQQNAAISPSRTDNYSDYEKAAQLGVNIAWTVEGGFSLIKGGISALKNGFKVAKSWFEVVEVVKVESEAVTALNPTHYLTKSKTQMQTLVDDVRANGIQESIKYVESNGVKYIVDGHHRYFAAKKLGIQNVPVEQVKLPYSGYKTAADLTLDGTMPGYWKYIK